MTIQPGTKIGKYQIVELIGRGGMAVVYKAKDTSLDSTVAIKFIRMDQFPQSILRDVVRRFQTEAKNMAQLSHPNIVQVSDYGKYQGVPFLVMQYMPKGSLKNLLGKPMPYQKAASLLLPVAKALAFIHEEKIIHRDVKPSNILFTKSKDPMLADFGVAKIIDREETRGLTATGASIGTPEYMAPEQALGKKIDHRVDIYSLGVILFELVTGRRPFTADTPMEVAIKQARDPLPNPTQFVKGLPAAVEQVIQKALDKKPDKRFKDMGAFAAALEDLAAGVSIRNSIKKTRFPSWIWLAGFLTLSLIAVVWLVGLRKPIALEEKISEGIKAETAATFPTQGTTEIEEKTYSDVAADEDAQPHLEIGYITPETSGVLGLIMKGLVSYAEKKVWEVYTVDSNIDVQIEALEIENLITLGVDAIVTVPVDAYAICASIENAKTAGIPFYTIDRPPNGCEVDMTVLSDNYIAGQQAGEYMVSLLREKYVEPMGIVLELQGDMSQTVPQLRSEGFYDVMAKYPKVTILSRPTYWLAEEFYSETLDVLGVKDVDGIYMHSDCVGTIAVLDALEKVGKKFRRFEEGHIFITGVDGCPDTLDAIRDGYVDQASSQPLLDFGVVVEWIEKKYLGELPIEGKILRENVTWSPASIEKGPEGYMLYLSTTSVTHKNANDISLWGNQ